MHERIAKITSTMLGREDHGIFTAQLTLDYGGSGQGAGGFALDGKPKDSASRRPGTAAGMDFIIGIIDACGVDCWEKVAGRTVLAILDSDDWSSKVIGLKPLPTERGKPFIFADAFDQAVRR